MKRLITLFLIFSALSFAGLPTSGSKPIKWAKSGKEVCRELKNAKFTEVGAEVYGAKKDFYNLSLNTRSILKTDSLTKTCSMIKEASSIKSGLLGEYIGKKMYYQTCYTKDSADVALAVFESVSTTEIQKIFSSESLSGDDFQMGVSFSIPEFAVHQHTPLLKISWVIPGTGPGRYYAQYYYFDSKYWQKIDTSFC
jgi:hypothetical protein